MKNLLVAAVGLFLITACGAPDGHQGGKYSVSGSGWGPVDGHIGLKVYQINGHRLRFGGVVHAGDPEIPLIGIVFTWNPTAFPKPSNYRTSDGLGSERYMTRILIGHHETVTELGWDRRTRVVEIEGQEFRFSEGIVFKIDQHDDGSVSVAELSDRRNTIGREEMERIAFASLGFNRR